MVGEDRGGRSREAMLKMSRGRKKEEEKKLR